MKKLISCAALIAASIANAAPASYSISLLEIPSQSNYSEVAEQHAAARFGDYVAPYGSLPSPGSFSWPEVYHSISTDRNAAGAKVGVARIHPDPESANDYRSWFQAQGETAVDMGILGSGRTVVFDMNNAGQAVGFSDIMLFDPHAFVWDNGVMYDLNALVTAGSDWVLTRAVAINDEGTIIGLGRYQDQYAAFLASPTPRDAVQAIPAATPVPEPETCALLLAGLGLLAWRKRR